MTLFGIDCEARLTKWPAGYRFGIFRAGREFGYIDVDYAHNVKVAKDAGAVAGAYHYIGHGRPIRSDCRRFVDAVGDPRGLLISPDLEDAGLTWDEVLEWFDEFRSHHPNHPLLVYTYKNFWNKQGYPAKGGAELSPYLWAANPVTGTYLGDNALGWTYGFGGWRGPVIWQYRHTTNIGVGAGVDVNAFRGTLDQLRLLTRSLTDTATGDTVSVYTRTERRGTLTIAAGTTVRGFRPEGSGWVVAKTLTPATNTSAPFRATLARVSGSASPSSLLEVSDGYFSGLYVSTAEVGEEYAPVPTVAGFAERLRADLPAYIDQKVKEYGA